MQASSGTGGEAVKCLEAAVATVATVAVGSRVDEAAVWPFDSTASLSPLPPKAIGVSSLRFQEGAAVVRGVAAARERPPAHRTLQGSLNSSLLIEFTG